MDREEIYEMVIREMTETAVRSAMSSHQRSRNCRTGWPD